MHWFFSIGTFIFGSDYSNPSVVGFCLGPFLSNTCSKDSFILSYLLKFYKVAEDVRNREILLRSHGRMHGLGTLLICRWRKSICWEKDRNPEYTVPVWLSPGEDSPLNSYWLFIVRTLPCASPWHMCPLARLRWFPQESPNIFKWYIKPTSKSLSFASTSVRESLPLFTPF